MAEHVPKNFKDYYEPFVGGGSLLFKLKRKSIINDINIDLMDTYRAIQKKTYELIKELEKYIDKNNEQNYKEIKEIYNSDTFRKMKIEERAALFIYLINTSFGSKYRVKNNGKFNNTFWKQENKSFIPNTESIIEISKYLKENVSIRDGDFSECLHECKENDFIYIDPPYKNRERYYNATRFSTEDQERLKNLVDELNKKKCKIMITNLDSEEIRSLFSDYDICELRSDLRIDSKSELKKETRNVYKEVLIKNY